MSTIQKIVDLVDQLRENAIPQEVKVRWIGELDALIALEVMKLDVLEVEQFQYDASADMGREPLVRFPHDNIYHYWLCAKIDAENGEYNRYQNSMQMYNAAFMALRTWFSQVYDVYNASRENPGFYISAYGLAVQQGFRGTLDQWLYSLIGPRGPKGEKGETGESGVVAPVNGFFTLAVDANGDLWAYSAGGGVPFFEYNAESGDLYVVQERE